MVTKTSASRKPPTAPLIETTEKGLASILEQYQEWRTKQPLAERFAELLWSPEGMWPEAPTPTILRWDAKRKRSIAEPVDGNYWLQRKMNRQRLHGDGHLEARAEKQRKGMKLCRIKIYRPLAKMRERANRTSFDYTRRLSDLENRCAAEYHKLELAICAIGERFRDAYWLAMHTNNVRKKIRDEYRPRALNHARLPQTALIGHYRLVKEHLGPVIDPDCQAYETDLALVVEAMARAAEHAPKVASRLDFSAAMPRDANYSGPSEGQPQPPTTACRKALSALRPKLPAEAVRLLLAAWRLTGQPRKPLGN